MFPCLTIFIIFIAILTYHIHKSDAKQAEVEAAFWQKEYEANSTRKADISTLDYISIPLERFPPIINTDAENDFRNLADKKIINFSGMTNTDLKLKYGVGNLEILSEYENNYNKLIATIIKYSNDLIESNHVNNAIELLEFAVSIHADVGCIYTKLADIYKDSGKDDKIPDLISKASSLQIITKESLVHKLEAIYHT
ncbi:hypothetical protein [Lachnobacterium bovis]|uniref:Tetratricopeptide repeat-containing protein n=1 Tax=Lachnobacterium bovis DSM 14045 TaxID=1122142 RepID=A0A1H3KBM7_9FIRM|nr:hypothetical protein [Lachnobacterium bovis]SDY48998.1 hypothetical protein SAMN02910414_01674 [Lachnobacterium bovis DSM 14045]